ncbi:hypothetical protein OQH61_07645 [Helicobacter sp. MIT 21-1697]|uniref:hypothetical protein n=1 Tax=Helicobacter sp. MIT 21-1697 TaxID=2993733 RepID=UPI00224ABE6B|nr:hypothetical protein [Helicobacter sp. MIT 21-1697]MCX2717604.1 hypothetical protein [Helicobacter sp. MIT 21-1697]
MSIVKFVRKLRQSKIQHLRVWYYRHILSNVKVQGHFKILSPTLFHRLGNNQSDGQIHIDNEVHLGYFPSPYFYTCHNYIDVRGGGI